MTMALPDSQTRQLDLQQQTRNKRNKWQEPVITWKSSLPFLELQDFYNRTSLQQAVTIVNSMETYQQFLL
jgi:hypothetical protein